MFGPEYITLCVIIITIIIIIIIIQCTCRPKTEINKLLTLMLSNFRSCA
jgi:hypothetical protein